MTESDKRLTRIENALETMVEGQAKHAEEIAELRKLFQSLGVAQLQTWEGVRKMQETTSRQIEMLAGSVDQLRRSIDLLKGN